MTLFCTFFVTVSPSSGSELQVPKHTHTQTPPATPPPQSVDPYFMDTPIGINESEVGTVSSLTTGYRFQRWYSV